jgi:hypothetical protein
MQYVARRAVDTCEPALSYFGRRSDITRHPSQHMQPRSKPLSAAAVRSCRLWACSDGCPAPVYSCTMRPLIRGFSYGIQRSERQYTHLHLGARMRGALYLLVSSPVYWLRASTDVPEGFPSDVRHSTIKRKNGDVSRGILSTTLPCPS